MYASHSKNINKNKSFHALSGKNQYLKAKKEGEEEERKAALEKRSAELASQKRAYAFDSMVRAADSGGEVVKFTTPSATITTVDGAKRPRDDNDNDGVASDGRDRDTRWMFKDDTHRATTTNTTATQEPSSPSASNTTATTGRITKEEAAKMQLDLDRAKKLKNDPLYRADQVEARLRGGTTSIAPSTATTTSSKPGTPLTSKQRMDAALAKLRSK